MSLVIPSREVESAAAGFVTGSFYGSRGTGKEIDRSVSGRESRDGYGSDAQNGGGSSESSSIGAAGESSLSLSEGEEEEVESKMKDSLVSMDCLDDALPIKRGLSNFFNGKSKSFAALSDVVTQPMTASDLAKPENPFNKRRRILMANRSRWPRRASCGSLNTAASMTLTLNSANLFSLEEDEEGEDKEGKSPSPSPSSPSSSQSPCPCPSPRPSPSVLGSLPSFNGRSRLNNDNNSFSFRSARSFSLGDLQQHAEPSFPESS